MLKYQTIIAQFYGIDRYSSRDLLPDGFVPIKKEIFKDRTYLIKFSNYTKNRGKDNYIYFNEIEWLKYLQKYDFVPKLYESKVYNENIYILMEYLQGKSLDNLNYRDIKFLQKNQKEFRKKLYEVLEIFKKELIIHRDLRPHNIIFIKKDKSFELKIIDFQFMRKIDKEISNLNESHYKNVYQNIGGEYRDKKVELNSFENDKVMVNRVIEEILKENLIQYLYKRFKKVIKWKD
jgi:serine/threonine protein kinase